MEKVIAVFDIGKTNKKILLFNHELKMVFQAEEKFPTITDEDGVECDDIALIERWIKSSLEEIVIRGEYELMGVNFSTYGASLVWTDENGNRLTPVYNYLKPIPDSYQKQLFEDYGGEAEFCRKTASPALGVMLNSGIQIKWFKNERPKLFKRTKSILHFPQYLSSLLTGKAVSEYTSIGCHTYMWDYDNMQYHQWLADEGVHLPDPVSNSTVYEVMIAGKKIACGIGIHDSSSSLAPYFKGCDGQFLLVGTGTWCINMNPFNHNALTASELKQDCLCYMSITQNPVKSSRLFMGHIHDVNVERLINHFGVDSDSYKKVITDCDYVCNMLEQGEAGKKFFTNGIPSTYLDETVDLNAFENFDKAYHRFMFDLTLESLRSILLVSDLNDEVKNVFVSGGFARNEIFVRLLADFLPGKKIFTSEVDNSSALGAALVIADKVFPGATPVIDLGLIEWHKFEYSVDV